MEIKCLVWQICGAGPVRQYWAQKFPYGDPRRNYINIFCSDENLCRECPHYSLRVLLIEWKKKEREEMEQMIVVPEPYIFELETKILRRKGQIVKNCWNISPTKEEADKIINDIEEAIEFLKSNSQLINS